MNCFDISDPLPYFLLKSHKLPKCFGQSESAFFSKKTKVLVEKFCPALFRSLNSSDFQWNLGSYVPTSHLKIVFSLPIHLDTLNIFTQILFWGVDALF